MDPEINKLKVELDLMERRLRETEKAGEDIRRKNEYLMQRYADACAENETLKLRVKQGQEFKAFVHRRLDEVGVPKEFPDGKHTKEGCRIGDRLDWVFDQTKVGLKIEPLPEPAARCWSCRGSGKVAGQNEYTIDECRVCDGKGVTGG